MPGYYALKDCDPTTFVSNTEVIAMCLQVLPNDTLFDSILRFCTRASRAQQTKVGLTKIIMEDFHREKPESLPQANEHGSAEIWNLFGLDLIILPPL